MSEQRIDEEDERLLFKTPEKRKTAIDNPCIQKENELKEECLKAVIILHVYELHNYVMCS